MNSEQLIKINGLNKVFKNGEQATYALKDVDLTISDGELISIEGPSGSGKSTLLSLLGLLDDVSSGTIHLRGQEIGTLNSKQKSILRNQHIGWIFQNFNLVYNLTALENVSLPLRYNSQIKSADYRALAVAALEKVGLAEKLNSKPAQLSGGQQQRVAIARAIACSPSLVLADEPTGNLDSATSNQIMKLLLDMSKSGVTIIIVTHDEDVAKLCHRRIKIFDGKVSHDVE